ncbi:hypothetical protein FIBSPDRAFT_869723 [Athelia psychrophila]|uniref:Uncharacterized protein n=1 Tax=Athelia psychrophila TaxID=1759441 RepID=A0A166BYH5_9AGAM|nr:hypothetical protein FIBSPDRAFT_869723 [Fibularhizoctonia sp. CBS 109695]
MQSIMDQPYDISEKTHEQAIAAKQRFESFKMGPGKPRPASLSGSLSKPAHGRTHSRSHSRTTSVNSLSSMPVHSLSASLSVPSVKPHNDAASTSPVKQRPNSHHRRRSSVSTRRESAEMMGVAVPDLPTSKSEDNINLGDKDSIRRRALWALEGKQEVSYAKVEIPELASPVQEAFAFPSMPSHPSGTGTTFGNGMNSLAGKRDSLYMGPGTSNHQLNTLVEEDEEEEEEATHNVTVLVASPVEIPATPTMPTYAAVAKPSPRPRPASLNLRPLSLTTGSTASLSTFGGLPTPTLTPVSRPGLKTLALASSPNLTNPFMNNNNNDNYSMTGNMRRQSLNLTTSPMHPAQRRPSLNLNISCDGPTPSALEGQKRSSISYKSSSDVVKQTAMPPSPEMTPIVSERGEFRWSGVSQPQAEPRPLSESEQHFLFKSHNALLARITDLESALTTRSRSQSRQSSMSRQSRPGSMVSDASSMSSQLDDETLSLITDLKSERDELKRDVDGWRTRVADLEGKVGVMTKRVESERMEAWCARSRLAMLEPEKAAIEQALGDKLAALTEALGRLDVATSELDIVKADNELLQIQAARSREAEQEILRLRAELEEERGRREELECAQALVTPTPDGPSGRSRHWFQSMDSEASLTDVESLDGSCVKGITLKAVEEEEESYDEYDDDDGLAGYEDEDEADMSFDSPDSNSSLGSMDEYTRAAMRLSPSTPGLLISDTSSESTSPSPTPTPPAFKHAVHKSLSRTWTFPTKPSAVREQREEVDNFFGCLDDLDNSPPVGFMSQDSMSLFSQAFSSDDYDDEMPPFVLPNHVGVEDKEAPVRLLDMVMEEEDEEEEDSTEQSFDESFEGEEYDGGIRFTFNGPSAPIVAVTPPCDSHFTEPDMLADVPSPVPVARQLVPMFVPFDEDEESDVPFTFSAPKFSDLSSSLSFSSADDSDADISVSVRTPSPSSIPRPTALKCFTSSTSFASTPTKSGRPANAYMTPPSKRGGMMPSFIPQLVPSPLKNSSPAKAKAAAPTLMRQPQRRPLSGVPNANEQTSELPEPRAAVPSHEEDLFSSSPAPSSFSSSLQSLTSWWSTAPSVSAVKSSVLPESLSTSVDYALGWSARKPKGPVEKKFVSKDKQLEKLRQRLDQERRADNRAHFAVDVCRSCGPAEVHL